MVKKRQASAEEIQTQGVSRGKVDKLPNSSINQVGSGSCATVRAIRAKIIPRALRVTSARQYAGTCASAGIVAPKTYTEESTSLTSVSGGLTQKNGKDMQRSIIFEELYSLRHIIPELC
eukprot:gene797-245_t